MGINLGDAGEQKELAAGPIPRKSMVKVRMEIRKPKKADPQDPAVTVFKSGLKGLDCEFTVISGQFENVKIWENWFLPPGMQTISLNKGQEGICNGSFAKCRAVIEAARRIDPKDQSDTARANRNINSWIDLHGLEFPVKVGIDKPKPGDQYINNNILKVLTLSDAEYEHVMGGGEIISDEPIPDLPPAPQTTTTTKTTGAPTGNWGNDQAGQNPPPPTKQQPHTQTTAPPTWAQ